MQGREGDRGVVVVLWWCCGGVVVVLLWCCCGVVVVLLWWCCGGLEKRDGLKRAGKRR